MKNLSLNKKIVFLISIFVVSNFISAGFSLKKINEINDSLNYLAQQVTPRLVLAKNMDAITNEIKNQEKVYILEENSQEMNKIGAKLDELETDLRQNIKNYEKIATADAKAELNTMSEKIDTWKSVTAEIRKLSQAGQNKEAAALARGASKKIWDEYDDVLKAMVQRNEKMMASEATRTDELVTETKSLVLSITIIALLAGSILAFFMMRIISNAIDQVINNLNDSSSQVASASSTIASSSEELSQATTEQAASLEQTAASVEEMSKMVNRNAENARAASENSQFSQQSAIKGKETVNEMIRSIDEINNSNNKIMEQINHSNEQMADIVKVINEIGNKTKVINDIVFQTKLLSFNASVEAARAGEHGKGFAVVAEEVGNLASMSGNAAKEITTMLDESIRKVEMTVQETKTSVDRLITDGKVKINNGIKVANDCGNVLEEIVVSIAKVNAMAEEISTASVEQSQGISEITKAMHQLDQVTQQNAAASEEAASSAEELSAQAEVLKSTVGVLVTTIKGGEQTQQRNSSVVNTVNIAPTYASSKTNVIQMTKPASKKTVSHMPVKKAVGAFNETTSNERAPAYDDARFKDV